MPRIPRKKNLERSLSADTDRHTNDVRRRLSLAKDVSSIKEEEGAINKRLSAADLGPASHRLERIGDRARFPKLQDCAHFHYENVEISRFQVSSLFDDEAALAAEDPLSDTNQYWSSSLNLNFQVQTSPDHVPWIIERSVESLSRLDRQLHQCVFDRKYSLLPELCTDLQAKPDGQQNFCLNIFDIAMSLDNLFKQLRQTLSSYFQRFSAIADNMINCGTVLSWFEMDNRGNRVIVSSNNDGDCAINIPAVGAAVVVKRYIAQAPDEISLEVGEIISLIDMPPTQECNWWRGKRKYEVGFFPADNVEAIAGKVPPSVVAKVSISQQSIKPVLRRRGEFIVRLRAFFSSRPARSELKQSGIVKERVFGCDLGEHLLNSGCDVPRVLKFCTEVIETHGVVDGIYRLSGIASNIQKLRTEFDAEITPSVIESIYLRDIHSISSLLKMYFRELPNPLLTYQLYDKFVTAIQDEDYRLLRMHDVIQQLPPPHYRTCAFLMRHLNRMASFGKKTSMTGKNLAIVWAPNLLRCKELEQSQCSMTALRNIGTQAVVTEFLINYADLLFSDNFTASIIGRQRSNSGRRQPRPKSLAVSTPTKLLSLQEARLRALNADWNASSSQVFLDVGGGPAALPQLYHTVIDLRKGRTKKSASSLKWKDILHRRRKGNKDSRTNVGESNDVVNSLTVDSSTSDKTNSGAEVDAEPAAERHQRSSRLQHASSSSDVSCTSQGAPPPKPKRNHRFGATSKRCRNSLCKSCSNCSSTDVTSSKQTPTSPTVNSPSAAAAAVSVQSSAAAACSDEMTSEHDLDLRRPRSVGTGDFGAELFASLSATVRRSLQGSTTISTSTSSSRLSEELVVVDSGGGDDDDIASPDDVFDDDCLQSPSFDSRRNLRHKGELTGDSCRRSTSVSGRGKYAHPLPVLPEIFVQRGSHAIDCDQEARLPCGRETFRCMASSDTTTSASHSGFQEELSVRDGRNSENDENGTQYRTCEPVVCSLSCARSDRLSSSKGLKNKPRTAVGGNVDNCSLSTSFAAAAACRIDDSCFEVNVSSTDSTNRSDLCDSVPSKRVEASQSLDEQNFFYRPKMTLGDVDVIAMNENEGISISSINARNLPVEKLTLELANGVTNNGTVVDDSSGRSRYEEMLFIDDIDESETGSVTVSAAPQTDVVFAASSQLVEKSLGKSLNDSTNSSAMDEPSARDKSSLSALCCSESALLLGKPWPVVGKSAHSAELSSRVELRGSAKATDSGIIFSRSDVALSATGDESRSGGYSSEPVSLTCMDSDVNTSKVDVKQQIQNAVTDSIARDLTSSTKLTVYFVHSAMLPSSVNGTDDDFRDKENHAVPRPVVVANGSAPKQKTVKELKSKFERNDNAKDVQQHVTPAYRYTRSMSCQGLVSDSLSNKANRCSSMVSSLPSRTSAGVVRSVSRSVSDDVDAADISSHVLSRSSNIASSSANNDNNNKKNYPTVACNRRDDDDDDPRTKCTTSSSSSSSPYKIPSVSARISCFEPLLSSSVRKSPEFQTIPQSKRARLSSCGSMATGADDGFDDIKQTSSLPDSSGMFEVKDGDVDMVKTDSQATVETSRFQSPAAAAAAAAVYERKLCMLLDVPPSCVKSFPKVTERKRLFEVDSVSSVKSNVPVGVQFRSPKMSYPSILSEKIASDKETPMSFGILFVSDPGKENKFNNVADLNGEHSGRRKLLLP